MLAPFEYSGYTDLALFSGWFENLLCPQLKPGDYVIMDNASFHKSDEIQDAARRHNVNIIYLPAYSPDLNSIEHVWANFKRNLRKIIKKYSDFQEAISIALDRTLSG
jgi:transposase